MPDASALGDSQGIIALLGTLGLGIWSAVNLRRGQRDTHDLDADKQELDRERFEADQHATASAEKDRIIETLRSEVERQANAREADQARHDRDLERIEIRHEAERALCARTTRRLHDDLLSTAAALRSEVDSAAARDSAHQGETHLQFEHGDDPA